MTDYIRWSPLKEFSFIHSMSDRTAIYLVTSWSMWENGHLTWPSASLQNAKLNLIKWSEWANQRPGGEGMEVRVKAVTETTPSLECWKIIPYFLSGDFPISVRSDAWSFPCNSYAVLKGVPSIEWVSQSNTGLTTSFQTDTHNPHLPVTRPSNASSSSCR